MNLRYLQQKDAVDMVNWMHDNSVIHYMSTDFASKSIEDCKIFIENSKQTKTDLHLAIVDDHDIYMGTVSLKHIDKRAKCAEFAIVVKKEAMGKGYSKYGMEEMLKIGIKHLGLKQIYWCVSKYNKRALRFYDKNGYKKINEIPINFLKNYEKDKIKEYEWYLFEKM